MRGGYPWSATALSSCSPSHLSTQPKHNERRTLFYERSEHAALAFALRRFHARAAAAASSPDTDAVTEFRLDSIPPITSISSRVSPIYTTSSVALQFQSDEEGSTYMCRWAGAGR